MPLDYGRTLPSSRAMINLYFEKGYTEPGNSMKKNNLEWAI